MISSEINLPSAGEQMRASWGSDVARAVNAHEAELQSLRQPGKWQSLRVEGALAPYAVRLHKTATDQTGLWEIYLPTGCCNVGGPCDPLNPPANGISGHEDDDPAWRSLGRRELTTFAGGSGDIERVIAVVEIHVKPTVKIFGVDALDGPAARRVVWASIRDQRYYDAMQANPNGWRDKMLIRDKPGDVFAADVATITATRTRELVGSSYQYGDWGLTITPLRTTPIDAAVPQGTGISGFDLVWVLGTEQRVGNSGNAGLALVVKKLLCVRQLAAAAGIAVTGDTMTDVFSDVEGRAVTIYARVNATDLSGGNGTIEVLKDPEGTDASSPYVVWLPLYETVLNVVNADYRAQSLVNLQLYHA